MMRCPALNAAIIIRPAFILDYLFIYFACAMRERGPLSRNVIGFYLYRVVLPFFYTPTTFRPSPPTLTCIRFFLANHSKSAN